MTGAAARRRHPLVTLGKWVTVAATAAALVAVAVDGWGDLTQTELSLQVGPMAAALGAMAGATAFLVAGWWLLLAAYGYRLGIARAQRAWALSQATRYIPSGLVPVFARAALVAPDGVPRAVTSMSVVVETLTLLGWTALGAAVIGPGDWLAGWVRALVGGAAALGLATLPFTFAGVGARRGPLARFGGWVLRRLPARTGLGELTASGGLAGRPAGVWMATGTFGAAVAARLCAYGLVGAALLDLGRAGAAGVWSDATMVVGAGAVAITVGMVGVTPAGVGVREGALAAMLAPAFGLVPAATYAVVLRAAELAVEAAQLAVAGALGRNPGRNSGRYSGCQSDEPAGRV